MTDLVDVDGVDDADAVVDYVTVVDQDAEDLLRDAAAAAAAAARAGKRASSHHFSKCP